MRTRQSSRNRNNGTPRPTRTRTNPARTTRYAGTYERNSSNNNNSTPNIANRPPRASRANRRRSAPNRRRSTTNTPGGTNDVVIELYQGVEGTKRLAQDLAAMPDLCNVYAKGQLVPHRSVGSSYVSNLVRMMVNHVDQFAVVARKNGAVVGFLVGNATNYYESHKQVRTRRGVASVSRRIGPRVVVIHLVCSQGRTHIRGVGSVLLRETEAYARDALGATVLILHSVPNPGTVRSYRAAGFERSLAGEGTTCSVRYENGSQARTLDANNSYAVLMEEVRTQIRNGSLHEKNAEEYLAAANKRYYTNLNSLDEGTVVMTKCLSTTRDARWNSNVRWNSDVLSLRGDVRALAVYEHGPYGHLQLAARSS